MPESANILGLKLNTAYSRLRLARRAFDDAVARARAEGRLR
jgi:DNA-directed RNA polymerase specialized sigma24 family protein